MCSLSMTNGPVTILNASDQSLDLDEQGRTKIWNVALVFQLT